ncbi:MAG: acyl-CoA thioesterase [Agathobaculum sp.]|uniref:acyl-CoA thioesterase n=1 Tax=Agathobaculum sp. TaxID=2048138 RepID=UPI0025BCC572|nr:thioesterase family protein [Agathobaculum sp.]MCI7126138.1 acyl-CoA thioesterase [Agathobaculum sp.]MDY3710807.1 thioesterase family protein [Agathobaculum sp.]
MTPYAHKAQYYETDGMGIIHHSNYIRWFEEARVDLLEQLGIGYDIFEAKGYSSPVLGVTCDYHAMVRFAETVCIETRILSYTGVKLRIGYTVRDKQTGALRCTGETRHCFLRAADDRPVSLKRVWPEAHEIFAAALADNAQ